MKLFSSFVAAALSIAMPFTASGRDLVSPPPDLRTATEAPRLLIALSDYWVPPGTRELLAEIRADGQLQATLRLGLAPDGLTGTYELLAGDPDRLSKLLAEMQKGGPVLELRLYLDGAPLVSQPLADALARARELVAESSPLSLPQSETRRFEPEPSALRGKPTTGSPLRIPDPACVESCDIQLEFCLQVNFGCAFSAWPCWCYDDYYLCINDCPTCVDPLWVEYIDAGTDLQIYTQAWQCHSLPYGNLVWEYQLWIWRQVQIERYHLCSGAVVDTVVYQTQNSRSCSRYTGWPCGPGYPPLSLPAC